MAKLGTAYVELLPDMSHMRHLTPASGQLGRYTTGVKTAETHSSKLASTSKRLGSSLASAAKYAAGAAVAYIGIAQAEKAVQTTQDLAKTTISLNQNLGIGIKRSSEWGATLQARGVDSTKAGMAFKTFATQVDSANKGSATSIAMFKELGITQKDLAQNQDDVQKLLLQSADGIDKLGAGTARTTAESKLFGRGWATVAPLMRDGSAALKDNLDLTKEYGDTLNKHTLKAQQDLLASQRESKIAWQGLQLQFTTAITPALQTVEGQFQRIARVMADPRLSDDQKFHRISHIIESDLSKALDFVVREIPTVADHVGQEAPKIAEGLVNGFLHADVMGQLVMGAWFFKALGGGSAIRGVGTSVGKRVGGGIEAGLLLSIPLMAPFALKLGEMIGNKIKGPIQDALDWARDAANNWDLTGDKPNIRKDFAGAGHQFKILTGPQKQAVEAFAGQKRLGLAAATEKWLQKQRAKSSKEATTSIGQDIAHLIDKYGLLTTASEHLSRTDRENWIKRARTAHEQGKINASAEHAVIAAMKAASDQSQKSSQQQQQASKDTADATQKSGKQQQEALNQAATSGAKAGQHLHDSFLGSVINLAKGVKGGLGNIEGNLNNALKGMGGIKAVQFTLKEITGGLVGGKQKGGPVEFAAGGLASVVPGAGEGDRHLLSLNGIPIAKVESKEGIFVGNRTMMGALGQMNEEIPRRQDGGYVDLWGKGMAHLAKGGQAATPYRNPIGPGTVWGRTDMGVDFGGIGGKIGAIGSGRAIVKNAFSSSGYGTPTSGLVYQMDAGAPKGFGPSSPYIYIYEGFNRKAGAGRITAGQLLGTIGIPGDSSIEMGYATGLSGTPLGAFHAGAEPHYTPEGQSFHDFLKALAGGKGVMGGAGGGAAVQKIARVLLKGPAGAMKDLGQAGLDKAWKAANAYIQKHAPKGMGGSMAGAGALQKPPKNLPLSLRKYDRRFAAHWSPDYGGFAMPVSKVAELAEWAGMPGVTMAQIAHGESGYRPGAAGVDAAPTPGVGVTKGYGLWAITSPFANQYVGKYGGYPGMWNPISNALVAKQMYDASGLAPWHGTRYLTSANAHYTGPMKKAGGLLKVPWFGDGGQITADHPTLLGIGDGGRETATITKGDAAPARYRIVFKGSHRAEQLFHEIVDEVVVELDHDDRHGRQLSRMGG